MVPRNNTSYQGIYCADNVRGVGYAKNSRYNTECIKSFDASTNIKRSGMISDAVIMILRNPLASIPVPPKVVFEEFVTRIHPDFYTYIQGIGYRISKSCRYFFSFADTI